MAYKCIKREWAAGSYLCEFVCDEESDIKDLPTDCCAGSTATVVEPLNVHMMNASGEWKKL